MELRLCHSLHRPVILSAIESGAAPRGQTCFPLMFSIFVKNEAHFLCKGHKSFENSCSLIKPHPLSLSKSQAAWSRPTGFRLIFSIFIQIVP